MTAKVKHTLLIIDDDEIFCDSTKDGLESGELEIMIAHTKKDGLLLCSKNKIDVLLLDQKLPDGEGHLMCPDILAYNEDTKIIFVTAYPSFEHAVKAIKAGAYDYLSKPFSLEELRLAIHRSVDMQVLERVKDLEYYRAGKERDDTVLVGNFGETANISAMIKLAASVDSPVLITGETGTGKNVVAKAIHFSDLRRDAQSPFINANCAALPDALIENELFGHERGAFTDATTSRKGIFELAGEGTLFLDEIGDMPLHLQAKLLGVLDDKKIRRLGGQTVIPVNARVIAATNRDLKIFINEKKFRKDLFYRLSVIRIHIPPLRERPLDIPQLCKYFVDKMARSKKVELPEEQMEHLMDYHWPGNVRELKNIIERCILLHDEVLRPAELIDFPGHKKGVRTHSVKTESGRIKMLEQVEKEHILRVLDSLSYNYTQSAKALGISLSTLKRKVKEYRVNGLPGLRVGRNAQYKPGVQNESSNFS